jgi:hypothetical protein
MHKNRSWISRWEKEAGSMNEVSPVAYWDNRAEDYDNFIRTSRFSYGKNIVRLLRKEQVLSGQDLVLEIAGGVGALTLPLCRETREVVCLEPAPNMADYLKKNLLNNQIENCRVLQLTGQEYMHQNLHDAFGLGIICHASWQFPDLEELLGFFDLSCRSWACIADTAKAPESPHTEFRKSLGIEHVGFDRVLVLYNALCALGRNPNISFFNYTMLRSAESAKSMLKQVAEKYRQIAKADMEKINSHVAAYSTDGTYAEPATMGVIWWKTKG